MWRTPAQVSVDTFGNSSSRRAKDCEFGSSAGATVASGAEGRRENAG